MGSYSKDSNNPSTSRGKKAISHLESCLCCQSSEELKHSLQGKIQEIARSVHDIKQLLDCYLEEKIPEVVDNSVHNNLRSRSLVHEAGSSALNNFKLNFMGTLFEELITLDKIKASNGTALMVELLDSSGLRVEDGAAKIKIFVLDGDFNVEDTEDWSTEDFDKNVVPPRKKKGELLRGVDEIPMENGIAELQDIAFTDNSKSMRNGRFRLGARVVKGFPGEQIKDAVSNSFIVKERRGQLSKGHNHMDLKHRTNHLKNVGQKYAQKLADKGIYTVQDFLQRNNVDGKALEDILHLPDNRWSELVKDAKSYPLLPEVYKYCDPDSGVELKLDCVFDIIEVRFKGQIYKQYTALEHSEKELVNQIRRKAYEKRQEQEVCNTSNNIPRRNEFGSSSATTHMMPQHPNAMLESMVKSPLTTPSMNPTISMESGGQGIDSIPSHQTHQDEVVSSKKQMVMHYTVVDNSNKEPVHQTRHNVYENRLQCVAPNNNPKRDEFGSTYATPHPKTHHPNAMPESTATTLTTTPPMNPIISTELVGQGIHSIPLHQTCQGEVGLLHPNSPGHTAEVRLWTSCYQAPQTIWVSSGSQPLGSFSNAPVADLPLGSFFTTPSADFGSCQLTDNPAGMTLTSSETQDGVQRTNVPPLYMPSQNMPVCSSSSYCQQLQNSSQSLDLGAMHSSKKRPWPG